MIGISLHPLKFLLVVCKFPELIFILSAVGREKMKEQKHGHGHRHRYEYGHGHGNGYGPGNEFGQGHGYGLRHRHEPGHEHWKYAKECK